MLRNIYEPAIYDPLQGRLHEVHISNLRIYYISIWVASYLRTITLNQFTHALETADNMLSASERTSSLCAIFLFRFECHYDDISHEIVKKLQNLLGQYEQFTRRYMDIFQNLQEQETYNRFRCARNERAYGKRGRPRFSVTKAQIESLREIFFVD